MPLLHEDSEILSSTTQLLQVELFIDRIPDPEVDQPFLAAPDRFCGML